MRFSSNIGVALTKECFWTLVAAPFFILCLIIAKDDIGSIFDFLGKKMPMAATQALPKSFRRSFMVDYDFFSFLFVQDQSIETIKKIRYHIFINLGKYFQLIFG